MFLRQAFNLSPGRFDYCYEMAEINYNLKLYGSAKKYFQLCIELNPYNVYGYCFYNDSFGETKKKKMLSQESILMGIQKQFSNTSWKNA